MASTPVQFESAEGLTLTVELYPDGSDPLANGSGDTATEAANRDGTYTITVTEALTGLHQLKVFSGTTFLATQWVHIDADDTTTYYAASSRTLAAYGLTGAGLTALATAAALAAAQTDLDTITDTGVVATNMRGTDGANTTTPPTTAAIATAVWASGTRTLTSFGTLIADIWAAATRTLTAGTKDTEIDAIKAVTDKADDTLEDDGGTQRFTANALEQAPSGGGGGGGDATAANQAILLARTAAGVTVNATNQANANSDFANPIRRGDEYSAAAGNAFTITSTGYPNSPWGSSTTAVLKINQNGAWSTTGSVVVAHDASETITLTITLTETETAALTADTVTTYEVELDNGTIQRSIAGKWAVKDSDE